MSKPVKRGASSRKHAASKAEELTAHLAQWTEGEMGLPRGQVPQNDQIKMLLCSSAGNSMWQYLITHINTPKTVQLIRKNIQLQSGDVSGTRTQLLTERAELNRELTSLRLAVTQLETDLSRLRSDIATAAGVRGVAGEEVRESSRKSHLLSAHSVKCQGMVSVMNEFSKRIRYRIQVLSHQSKERSYFTKSGDSKTRSLQLESACKHDLARVCDQVGALLTQLATPTAAREGGGAMEEEDKNRRAKEQIWNKIESLLSGYSPAELMQCLCELTHEAREIVQTDTEDVDLSRDAKLLRYHYDHGEGLQDEVKRSNLLKSVEEHLVVLQLSHVQRSVELERCLGSGAKARERLGQLKRGVDDQVSSLYQEDTEAAQLVRGVFQAGLEVGGCEGALAAMTHICERLSAIREEKRRALKTLQDKKQSIDLFTQIAEERQSRIQWLVQANSAAWSRLNKQHNELQIYIRTKIIHHESELVPLAAGLHNSVAFELQRFSQLSIARMLRTPGTLGRPLPDLTVHRLSNTHPNGLPHWAELLETVGVASYEAPEAVLSKLNYIIDKVVELRSLAREKEAALDGVKRSSANALTANGVLLASRRCDRQQLEAGVPALQSSLSMASQGLAKCSTVQQTLHEWWEQPAQFSGHWITYESMTLEKWVDQWRVLSTKLQRVTSSANSNAGSSSMAATINKAAS